MANLKTISSRLYNQAKAKAIAEQPIRKEISLSEFNVVDNNHIEIDGMPIRLTDKAFGRLLGRLRIPKAFAQRFSSGFGTDGLRQLIEMMKAAKVSANDQTVTLLVDPQSRTIFDILPSGYASISNESFFDFTSRYIDQYGLGITHASSDPLMGAQINCVSESGLLQVPGLKNELFQTGVTFRNTPQNGLEVSPYLNRLVCTNGITTKTRETYGLHSLTDKSINEFNEHMLRLAASGFQPIGIGDTIRKAHSTNASLAEMQHAASAILGSNERIDYDYIQRYIPIERAMKAYTNVGADPATFTQAQLRNANSGMSVWDVINGMTNFASNDQRYRVDNHDMANIMVSAGKILAKGQYDTENLLQVDPFANSTLLSERESAMVRGDI